MKIDPGVQFPDNAQPERAKSTRTGSPGSQGTSKPSGVSSPSGEDTVQLSSVHSQVQTLAAGLGQVPEVRIDRVQALQSKVRSGSFQPDSGKVADAILKEHARVNARA